MKIKYLLLFSLLFISCGQKESSNLNAKLPADAKVVKIDIGIRFTDFVKTCGEPEEYGTYKDAVTEIVKVVNKKNTAECSGAFTFNNYKLESIVR